MDFKDLDRIEITKGATTFGGKAEYWRCYAEKNFNYQDRVELHVSAPTREEVINKAEDWMELISRAYQEL